MGVLCGGAASVPVDVIDVLARACEVCEVCEASVCVWNVGGGSGVVDGGLVGDKRPIETVLWTPF